MRLQQRVLTTMLGFAALWPGTALAHGFSKPVLLPATRGYVIPWLFAVNDRGQALAATRNLIYPVRASGRLGPPWRVTVPGGFTPNIGSMALDDRGRVAVGLIYEDGTELGDEHNPGCCEHVAVDSWQLGATPPAAQVLAPPNTPMTYRGGELETPNVVIGHTTITALWSAGDVGWPNELAAAPPPASIDEAYGDFGQPLQAVRLTRVPHGVQSVNLSLAPNGDPVAAWLDDSDELQTLEGRLTGELTGQLHTQRIPRFSASRELEEASRFASNSQGNTVFSYLSGSSSSRPSHLMMMTSRDGGRFTRPHAIATVGPIPFSPTSVLAGGHGSLLAFWGCIAHVRACYSTWALRGRIFGPLGQAFRVGENPQGYVAADGRTVIAYDSRSGIEVIVASPGHQFGRPHLISGHHCRLGMGNAGEPPLASSGEGATIFYYTCEVASEPEYMVRYTP